MEKLKNSRKKFSKEAKQRMKNSQLNYRIELRKKKYPNFNKIIEKIDRNNYLIKNYCEKHGDLMININLFNHIYNNNGIYCDKCNDEFISTFIPNEKEYDEIKNIFLKFYERGSSSVSDKFLKNFYPKIYKSILYFSEKYKDIEWNERTFLFKTQLNNKPKCFHEKCTNTTNFSSSNMRYNMYCEKHSYIFNRSKGENEIKDLIKKEYNGKIYQSYRKEKKEYDIYIPNLKLAIEYNGLYWHSDIYKDKKYHYNKWLNMNKQNIKLITIWEDDWNYKQDIVKSIIKNYIGKNENRIFARKCEVKNVSYNDTKIFLENNHLQGNCASSIRLGLFFNEELVSLMTFGKKRMVLKTKSENNEYELLRFCNKLNTSVVGGASKLFKYFIDNYKPHKVISYANCDISNGSLYKILGFENKGHTKINYWWSDLINKYHRSNFMKYKIIKETDNVNKTENEIMKERGFYKIYGTGNIKFEYINKII
jgi:hypothetical protein